MGVELGQSPSNERLDPEPPGGMLIVSISPPTQPPPSRTTNERSRDPRTPIDEDEPAKKKKKKSNLHGSRPRWRKPTSPPQEGKSASASPPQHLRTYLPASTSTIVHGIRNREHDQAQAHHHHRLESAAAHVAVLSASALDDRAPDLAPWRAILWRRHEDVG